MSLSKKIFKTLKNLSIYFEKLSVSTEVLFLKGGFKNRFSFKSGDLINFVLYLSPGGGGGNS